MLRQIPTLSQVRLVLLERLQAEMLEGNQHPLLKAQLLLRHPVPSSPLPELLLPVEYLVGMEGLLGGWVWAHGQAQPSPFRVRRPLRLIMPARCIPHRIRNTLNTPRPTQTLMFGNQRTLLLLTLDPMPRSQLTHQMQLRINHRPKVSSILPKIVLFMRSTQGIYVSVCKGQRIFCG